MGLKVLDNKGNAFNEGDGASVYRARTGQAQDFDWQPGDLKPTAQPISSLTGLVEPQKGWLLCNGQAVSRTTYKSLFDAIGTAYGTGDGSTTFNLPDFRGKFLLGQATSGTGSTRGNSGGSLDHTHTVNHTHDISHSHTINHTHSIGHTHDLGNHTHTVNAHTHDLANHTHSLSDHTHTVDSHTHIITNHSHILPNTVTGFPLEGSLGVASGSAFSVARAQHSHGPPSPPNNTTYGITEGTSHPTGAAAPGTSGPSTANSGTPSSNTSGSTSPATGAPSVNETGGASVSVVTHNGSSGSASTTEVTHNGSSGSANPAYLVASWLIRY